MRILIVEDEVKIALALKKGLEQERFAVDAVHDGREGLAFATTEEYDLVILDRMLPSLDGAQICEGIRAAGNSVPVLMLTAKSQLSDKLEGFASGADDYLPKPFAFEELLARVHALSRRPRHALAEVLKVGDVSLNGSTYDVTRGSTKISLSSTEFTLLQYLMRNAGRTLSKDQIISHVWDYDADVLPNTVEVYVGYLRAKLEKPFRGKPAVIKTVRGFGYQMPE